MAIFSLIFSCFLPRAEAQGWVYNTPPNSVTIGAKRNNVFYVGEPVCLWVTSGTATSFEVRNYFGTLVDSGTIADGASILSKVTAPGWYKLYVYGATNQGAPYGNIVGGTTFTIIRPDANFPSMPDSFEAGRYLSWNLKGHVTVKVDTIQQGSNGVVNGLFFDPAETSATATTVTAPGLSGTSIPSATGGASGAAVYVTSDAETEGNWKGVYGSDGYDVINDSESFPAYAQVTGADSPTSTWQAPTSDPRALERATSSTARIAAAVYSGQSAGNSFTIDINLTDGKAHQLALYALDWDGFGPRNQTIQLIDPATGTVLDTRTISFFLSGRYLIWNIQGHVQVVVTNNVQGSNADISGLFFDPCGTVKAPAATSAQFAGPDTVTQGNWIGAYGGDGYNVIGNQTSYPGYANVLPYSNGGYTWAADTTNPRALMKVSGTDRVAAALATPATSSLAFDVNLTDGQTHKFSVYAEDWGSFGPRAETITIIDANSGTVLDTETIGATNGPQDGLIDELMRGITGMGPQRYQINDASNPDPDIVHNQSEIAVDKQVYTPYDAVRKRVLMMAFPNGTLDTAGVQSVVQTFQNDVQYWEGRNEPNYTYTGSQFVTQELESFYQTVKGVNPALKVLGPAIVTIGPGYGLGWIQDFLSAGGANYIDGFSFHAYNNINGDFVLADESLQGLNALLAQYNASNLEKWQTEQGAAAGLYGAYEPRLQGRWDMVQMMAYEQFGIPKEHNILWYDVSHGFWDVPDFWENSDYSLEPAAPLMRVWSEELYGTTYASAFDFGTTGDKMYVGDYFTGTNKKVAAFMSQGDPYGQVELTVSGGTSIHCVSAFGCASDLPVVSGSVTLPVPELPVYVELQPNQTISVVPINWGTNLATQPGVTAAASGDGLNPWNPTLPNSISKIHDGVMRDWFYAQGNDDFPWADDTPYPGGYPATVELDFPTVQTIDHVVVYANPSWELYGTLLDYDLQYDSGGQWVTIQHISEPANTLVAYTPYICCTCDSFFSDRWIFPQSFAPIATDKIRLLVNNVTYGGAVDADLAAAGYLNGPACINLRQIEAYNASGVDLPGTGTPVTNGSNSSMPTAVFVKSDTATKGNWKGVYGSNGFNTIDDSAQYPAYVTVNNGGAPTYEWTNTSSDVRALQEASSTTNRIAACWYSPSNQSSFTIDLNFTDGNAHQFALYALDWDGYGGGRAETIQIVDPSSGNVLNTESLTSFQNGEYLVWTIQGHVQAIVTTNNPNSNSLVNGLFFDPPGTSGSAPEPLQVSSTAAFSASGPIGGAFTPGSDTYALSNSGSSPVNWSASATQSWLSLSSSGGTLSASGSTTVTASINANASVLASGTYTDTITFTDLGTAKTQTEPVTLTVTPPPPPVITSTLTAIATYGAGFNYQITASNSPTSFGASGLPAGLSVNSAGLISGTATASGTTAVTISASNAGGTGTATLLLTVLAPHAAIETLYIAYSNGDGYVEEYNSSGPTGVNRDLGPMPGSTTDVGTPNGIAFDSNGNLYVANDSGSSSSLTISKFDPNGNYLGAFASGFVQPCGIAVDSSNNVYVADGGNNTIVKITPSGSSSVFVSSGLSNPQGIAFGPDGNLYVADLGSNSVKKVTPSGQVSTFYSDGSYTILSQVEGVAVDTNDNVYVSSNRINTIEKITQAGVATLFASNPSPASDPNDPTNPSNPEGIYNPIGMAFDKSGDLFVCNFHHTQIVGLPYEGHGITYIDEFSPNGTLISAFSNNPSLPGEDPNLRDGNFIAIKNTPGPDANDALQVSSTANFIATGTQGGPFPGVNDSYGLSNASASSLSWGASVTTSWLSVSATGGTLGPGSSITVTAYVNASASTLSPGTYTDNVTFTNYNTGYELTEPVNFTISSSANPVITSTLAATATTGSAFSYSITATNSPSSYNAFGLPAGLSVNTSSGLISGTATSTGTSTVTITAVNTSGTGSASLVLSVVAAPSGGTTNSAVFVKSDTAAKGNWKGVYGSDGFNTIDDTVQYPAYMTVNNGGAPNYEWTNTSTDVRALEEASSTTNRIAACWYSPSNQSNFTIDLKITDGNTHQLALYAVDWDGYGGGRAEKIQFINPANGAVLDTESLTSFQNGEYLVWNIQGHVQAVVTTTNPNSNALVNGLFFDPPATSGSATERLQVSSTGAFSSSGTPGGPFSPGSETYALSNSGTAALNWSVSATQSWLTLSTSGGTLSGSGSTTVTASINANANALASGTYTDTITFTDLGTANTQTEPVTLTVTASPPPVINSSLTATATNGAAFSYQIVASNNPKTYGATGLPSGLGVNTSTGLITGSTTVSGTSNVTLSAANTSGTGTATLVLTVLPPPPVINSSLTATATNGVAFSYQIAASNNPTSFGATGLPSGLNVSALGLISGTPTATGTSNITITAGNAGGSGTATLVLTVLPPPPVITSSLTATATSGLTFSYQIAATNNPTGFGATGLPSGLSVNALGLISGTPTATGTSHITLTAGNAGGSGTATLVLTVLPPPPVINSSLTATATNGVAFSYQIAATNNPTSFGATGLPSGLSVNALGLISGTVTATGTDNITITAGNAGGSGTATLVLTVLPPPPVINSSLTATATNGVAFSYQIAATNNPTSFGAAGLPSGLNVNALGLISGTPTATGTSNITITAGNAGGSGTATLVLTVLPPLPVITSSLTATATNGVAFSYQIAATNKPTSFGATGLPSGLNVNALGLISGTPSATGTSHITLTAGNAGGSGTATLVLTVLPPPPVITSSLTATATNGVAFSYQIAATNNPTSFGATGLPSGLNVNALGLISGTPTVTGTSHITLTAGNAGGSGTATLVLTVLPPPPVINSSLTATATSTVAFSYQIAATNNPTSFGATGLPSGLSVNALGLISGTPTATGTSNITITAGNAGGSGTATLVLTVLPPPPVITSSLTATATNGVAFSYQIAATSNPTSFGATSLPSGLSVNALGLISGTVTATGTDNITITAGNAGGLGTATLVLTVLPPPPVISSQLTANATYGAGFNYQITASNSPTSFGASGLPAGLSVNSAGLISGTATATGTTAVTISASNAGGTGTATVLLTVLAPDAAIETLYIAYSNGDGYVEEYNSSGPTGVNRDLGPMPGSTTEVFTPNGIAFDSNGNLYVANDSGSTNNLTVSKFDPNGNYLGAFASGFVQPCGLAVDSSNNVYVADGGNSTIVKITPSGSSSVFVSSGLSIPQGIAFGPDGNLYVADLGSNSVKKVTPSGQVSTFYSDGSYAILSQVEGVAVDTNDNVYVTSNRLNTVEKITQAGVATLFASNPSPASDPNDPTNPSNPEGIYNPIGLAFDKSGDLFVCNFHHTQIVGLPYEGHGITYIDEFSPNGTLISAFSNNPSLPGEDPNLRDGNFIAIKNTPGPDANDALQVSSTANFIATGPQGGPYPGVNDSYGLSNASASSINWGASVTTSWLSVSATGGTLGPGSSITVTAYVNSSASTLSPGTYTDNVTFTNYNTGYELTEPVNFTISATPNPVISSSPVATATTGSAFSYSITATNSPSSYNATGLPPGLSVNTSSGIISGTATSTGTSTVTLSAANSSGTGTASLVLSVVAAPSGGGTTTGTNSAVFVAVDSTTEGSWKNVYGSDGFNIIGDTVQYPAYATVNNDGAPTYVWAATTSQVRALQKASNLSNRIAACWYSPSNQTSFTIDVDVTDGNAHQFALYALDWDGYGGGRADNIQIIDPTSGKILDTEAITAFQNGEYLVWTIQGHVQVIVTTSNPNSNSVVSGLFFDPPGTTGTTAPPSGPSAQFVALDGTTQGNWDAVYGSDGYSVLPLIQTYPPYASVTATGATPLTWAASTSDPRALQTMNREASCWYTPLNAGSSYTMNVNLTDGNSHRVALYAVDWDGYGPRSETIQITNAANGAVLDTESVSSFQNGEYLVWDLKGNVNIQVINHVAGSNGVLSGIFFGAIDATAQTIAGSVGAVFVNTDTATQGNWKSLYGTDGYNVAGGPTSYPAYATVSISGQSFYNWASSTTDQRATETSGGTSRVAGAWSTSSTYTVDLNLTDGLSHRLAVYALDWDGLGGGRSEQLKIIDPRTGNVLNTQTLSSFGTGEYAVWTLTGHVQLVVTNLNSASSAVISGLFLGKGARN